MIKMIAFSTEEEIMELTGVNDHDELWKIGFNLDDWDWGICMDEPICDVETRTYHGEFDPTYTWNEEFYENPREDCGWLYNQMDCYCAGFDHTEYDGKHYYLVHHA